MTARYRYHPLLGILFCLIGPIWLAACTPPASPPQRAVVYGTTFQPNTLNPITAPDIVSRSMVEMIFDGLVYADDHSQLHGRLATNWQISPDGKEWTFRLRRGVQWHDGRPFTADDVKFTYDTVIDPNSKPTVAKADYAGIQRVEAVDSSTVRFYLSRPNAAFLSRLVLGIAPKHLLAGEDLATTGFNTHPVGTGPFIFDSWAPGERVLLKANPAYFGGPPKVDRLIWKIVPDSGMLALQALNGEVDGAPLYSPADAASVGSSGRMSLYDSLEGNTQISLQLKNPLFQDVRVRRALAYGLDTGTLMDRIMMGAALPATSDILATSWGYNPDVTRYPYDPARARALLTEAGWRQGADGVLAREGQRFSFTLLTDAGHKVREQVMMTARQNWADLGLEVKVGLQERNSFVAQRVLKGDFDAVLLQSSVQIDPDISRRFHSNSIQNGQNFLNYSNPAVDRLLEQGLATAEPGARKQAYFEVQKIMAEDLPQISLFHPKTMYAFKPQIRGIRPSSTNLFWNVAEWEWK